jgi:penicillin-binding protein 2A
LNSFWPKIRRYLMHPRLWIALGAAFFIFILLLGWSIASADISKLKDPLPSPTLIYDRHGNVAGQLSSSRIDPVALSQIPLSLQQAIIAVEDVRFYEHSGMDVWAILRALWADLRAGAWVEGGSTLTQQLAKNMFLDSEKTITRKWKEAIIAIKIDMLYDKDTILELYLNQIYFGEGRWGVKEAARTYFGKSVQELTLGESALMAGLPKAPTHYSPFKNKEKALERRSLVLSRMREQGFITEQERKQAEAEPLNLSAQASNQPAYPSFMDYVMEEAAEKYGFTEEQLLTGGLHIYTTLEPRVQKAIQETFEDETLFPGTSKDRPVQAGAVVLDPYSGELHGLVGYRGEYAYRGFNRATQLKRQPGSTFKPIAVYAPALELGYTPSSQLYDGPLNINGYQPKDWDGRTRGQVSLYEAVVQSWNIPAVWLLQHIGIDKGMEFIRQLGIPLGKEDRQLGLALGGLSRGVSPLAMAQAYSVFPNGGTVIPAHAITKITAQGGHELVSFVPIKETVFTPSTAYTMTLLLQEVVREGTGKRAQLSRPAAGKTGTTELPSSPDYKGIEGARDAWFVGYTPELVTAVWMGYDETDPKHVLQTSGGKHPALVFRQIMELSLKDAPIQDFTRP